METITIPKQEYELLIKCKNILELESDKELSPEFLKKIEKARNDIKEGKRLKFKTKKEVENYFKAM